MAKRWSVEDEATLKKFYPQNDLKSIVKVTGRSESAIQWHASKLGLLIRDGKKVKASCKVIVNLTEDQLNFIKKGRNHSAVIRKAINLLMKNES